MGISSLCVKSVLGNVGCSLGLQCSVNQTQRPSGSLCRDLVGNLERALQESLNIKDVGEESLIGKDAGKDSSLDVKFEGDVGRASKMVDTSGVEKGNPKCLIKCATFPCTSLVLPHDGSSDMEEEEPETALRWLFGEEHYNQAYSRSVSLPSPLKLISAMKGSREKEGLCTEKLTVKWPPDVYDPPVTLMSHTVKSNKQQKSRNKKNWKRDGRKGQKSNSSRGKDKKQYHKCGAPVKGHRSVYPREMITDTNAEFVVGSQEPHSYCESSLKTSLSSMHYPVAEAF